MGRKSKYTYEMIEPLIVFSEVEGRGLYVEFALPGSSEVVESKANIKRENSVGGKVKRRMAMVARNQVRRSATRAIRGALGGGMLGRMGSMSTSTAMREVKPGQGPTAAEIENAHIEA
ncbi:MAG: hypothetical protein AAF570_23965, partial [Bacteroidota bacterium]